MTDPASPGADDAPADVANVTNVRAALRRAVATAAALGCGIDIGAAFDLARGAIVFSIGGIEEGLAVAVAVEVEVEVDAGRDEREL